MYKQLVRIIKNCGHRGKVGHIYEVVEKNPREGLRLIMPGETQWTFWYPMDCCEPAKPGDCTVPTTEPISFDAAKWSESVKALEKKKATWKVPDNADFAWHLDKVTEKVTNLLKEKNAAYGNSALNPANIFSKLDAVESLLVRMDDKIMRIKNKGINDKTEDTVDDLIGYLLLLKMALERK
jgi:hypothetical protein